MNISEIDDALSNALNALSAAQLTLRKGASPRELDILQKAFLGDDPRASDAMRAAQDAQDDLKRRLDHLEAGRDMDSQVRKNLLDQSGRALIWLMAKPNLNANASCKSPPNQSGSPARGRSKRSPLDASQALQTIIRSAAIWSASYAASKTTSGRKNAGHAHERESCRYAKQQGQ
jgi:hypothetical protein